MLYTTKMHAGSKLKNKRVYLYIITQVYIYKKKKKQIVSTIKLFLKICREFSGH